MRVLVINCGSSTIKVKFVETEGGAWLGQGIVEHLDQPNSGKGGPVHWLRWTDGNGSAPVAMEPNLDAVVHAFADLAQRNGSVEAVGHRVVHGGERFTAATLVNDEVLEGIEAVSELAPLHNPANLAGIRAAMEALPGVPQVAVFDTAFHATLPEKAFRYAIPPEYYLKYGIRRYGFHGTSHRYLSMKAGEWLETQGIPRPHRVVTLHLGNGCSATAVLDGRSIDTSMGFTPLEGLVMGTRTGTLDPAIVPFLMEREGWEAAGVDRFMNKQCGLLGLSGLGADMRDIERAMNEGHPGARLAFDVFCYRIQKVTGEYAAALGGLDALVFSGGIGENSAAVRLAVLNGLGWLGLQTDEAANGAVKGPVSRISLAAAPAALVIPTDEEGMIAAETAALVRA